MIADHSKKFSGQFSNSRYCQKQMGPGCSVQTVVLKERTFHRWEIIAEGKHPLRATLVHFHVFYTMSCLHVWTPQFSVLYGEENRTSGRLVTHLQHRKQIQIFLCPYLTIYVPLTYRMNPQRHPTLTTIKHHLSISRGGTSASGT